MHWLNYDSFARTFVLSLEVASVQTGHPGPEVTLFSRSTQLNKKFQLLGKIKMLKKKRFFLLEQLLRYCTRFLLLVKVSVLLNFMSWIVESSMEKCFLTLGPEHPL